MTEVQRLARFAAEARVEDLSDKALEQLKIRVRARGFDHTTQGTFAAAVAAAKAMRLPVAAIANAAAIAGTANVALRVTRTGVLSNWKGLAYPGRRQCAARL